MSADHLINASSLRECLNLTWYLFRRYERLGLLGEPEAYLSGRPLWHIGDVDHIQERINQYHRNRSEASNNALAISK
jgi:hypothetical protein